MSLTPQGSVKPLTGACGYLPALQNEELFMKLEGRQTHNETPRHLESLGQDCQPHRPGFYVLRGEISGGVADTAQEPRSPHPELQILFHYHSSKTESASAHLEMEVTPDFVTSGT